MKRKVLVYMAVFFLGIICIIGFASAAEEKEVQIKVINKIVIINQYEEVKPISLTSQPGTTVIWVNHSREPVEILFLDKKVVLACGSPVNFFVGKDGAYESGKIPFGGTASLCFLEKGKYNYAIKSSRTFYMKRVERDFKGVIIIE